jgi:hypothetical protein
MLTVDLDRITVISSGTYEDRCKNMFPRGPSAAIFKVCRAEILHKTRLYLDTYSHKVIMQ